MLSIHKKNLQTLNDGISKSFASDLEVAAFQPHLLAHFRAVSRFFYTFDYSVAMNVMLYALIPLSLIRHGKYIRMYPQVLPFTYEPGENLFSSRYMFKPKITSVLEALFSLKKCENVFLDTDTV